MSTHPSRSQGDRDVLEDLGLADLDNRTGSGEDHQAEHVEAVTPS
ncbi:Uncharacterised protein [Mycobacteroides abscessus subsp. massiliense]|nr:hypothetical protein [Mycobacteroides abscessus]SKY52297.1 Uncharacterised protein [Mycobacteroides abscessus subsp. massiliense]SKZ09397.1 Uncharacterised protein [Mycobacteroides abscessus subsp. massiliense]